MVLEATLICLDNSETMRNGDYAPSRFQAQADAVNLICGAKTQSNPENTVGVLTLAGKGAKVVVTPTTDLGKILQAMHDLTIDGTANVAGGVQVAQLALKHRQNKNQRQRIILFVGSELSTDVKDLVKIGKKLKKNNVACDVVNFGETEANLEKLEAFVAAVNSNDNSNLVTVPTGDVILSDVLISSPLMTSDGEGTSAFAAAAAASAAAAAAGGGGGGDFEFGVDPSVDPELALALRVSMEEERARQEAAAKNEGGEASGAAGEDAANAATAAAGAETTTPAAVAPAAGGGQDTEATPMDEDALLQQALAMSMMGGSDSGAAAAAATPAAAAAPTSAGDINMDEDPELALALQMSMAEAEGDAAPAAAPAAPADSDHFEDREFLGDVLSSLPGVDASQVLNNVQQQGGGDEEKDEDEDGDS